MLEIYDVKTEYLKNPCAVDARNPRFSWKLRSNRQNISQEWYHIIARCGTELLWDSGKVFSSECRFVSYQGIPLHSRQQVSWRVTVQAGEETAEAKAFFVMGLLHPEDWKAKWIEAETFVDPEARKPAVYLRRCFSVRPGLERAVLYSSAHGLYEFYFNGQAGTKDKFKPGLTSYYARIQYHTADVTELLQAGENVLAVVLADGWWRGVTGGTVKNNWGKKLAFLGQLELFYEDGTMEQVLSDESFRWSSGALRASDMLMGDIYDARLEPVGWKLPSFPKNKWSPVCLGTEHIGAELIPCRSVPVREAEHFTGREFRDSEGNRVVDFGQNIAGYVKMTLHHPKRGQVIHLFHGETLDEKGVFTQKNINKTVLHVNAFQEIHYVCSGEETETYQPNFAVFGFRYVKVIGDCTADFEAIAVYSTMERSGWFSCSDPMLNRLVDNCLWSQKGNYLDVAVDCPTRERNAWTGDAQVYVRTAADFMNVYPFYEKWLQDQALEQYASGKVGITFPSTSSVHDPDALADAQRLNPGYSLAGPTGNGTAGEDSVGWGDAAVWLPYVMYLCYGDPMILKNQYPTAKKWVDYELACAAEENPLYTYDGDDGRYIYDTRFHYGEWNEAIPREMPVQPEKPLSRKEQAERVSAFIKMRAKTGDRLVATAYLYRSCAVLSEMASVMDLPEDSAFYKEKAEKIRMLYAKYLIQEDGIMQPGHQAPYVRALHLGLCGGKEKAVQTQLLHEIKANGYHLNTGFLSTPFLLPTLCDIGETETAYRILLDREKPGWLYSVLRGMTTIPESWDGVDTLADSQNHYAYGSVAEFLFAYTAGIRPLIHTPGYREFLLEPVPGGELTEADCCFLSPYGEIRSSWKMQQREFLYTCTVPVSCTAHLTLPNGEAHTLLSGTYSFSIPL